MHEVLMWKWQIWIYLWAAGVAGGSYFMAYLINVFTGFKEEKLLRYATCMGIPFGLLGTVMLLLDLGKIRRFWHLLVRFYYRSPMSIGSWVLILWVLCGFFLMYLWGHEKGSEAVPPTLKSKKSSGLKKFAEGTNFILSLILIAYTGVLLSSTSLPVWKSYFLPALFVISACSTGFAGILIILVLKGERISHAMGQTSILLSLLEALVLVLFLLHVPSHVVVHGTLRFAFWGGVVVIALFLPIWFKLWNLGMPKENRVILLMAAWWILIGGIILRAVIVIGGQVVL